MKNKILNFLKQLNRPADNDHENSGEELKSFATTSLGQKALFVGIFVVFFITFHFISPLLSRIEVNIIPEYIYLFGRINVNGTYFFGFLLGILISYLFAYRLPLLEKLVKIISLFLASFIVLFITFHFLAPALSIGFLDRFPETVYLFDTAIRSSHFFGLIISVFLTVLFIFHPDKVKAILKFFFSFWGFKVVLSIVDILIFRNLLRASDADNFTMWTIPLLFAFLTNFLPFFFAVAFKTHQEGFEDKHEEGRVKRVKGFAGKFSNAKSDNRMRTASRTFLITTSLLLLATAWLISNQRWIQMNQSLNMSLAHFEDMGPHTILVDGLRFYIENPPLDELPPLAVMQDYWHLNESGHPIYGRYQQFLIDFTLLILPLLLIFVTMLASYFNVSYKITNKWYDMLEEITDRKKKKMRLALDEYEIARENYEAAKLQYEQEQAARDSAMRKLQVLLGATVENPLTDVTTFEKEIRQQIQKNALRTILNSYDTHLYNLDAWILNDLEIFKSKMATNHQELAIKQAVLDIDIHEIIRSYNRTVEPIKQFDTAEKTEELMKRLKMMNQADEKQAGDQRYE